MTGKKIDGTLRVAWLVGDGVGHDVMEATKLVLEAANLDIEFTSADVGWNFWCMEGNALPDRTMDVLKSTHCALMGPIISKPRDMALQQLSPDLRGKGFTYQSPVVRLRQEFELNTRIRPCKAFPGNKLNFNDDIDVTVFVENTEGLFCGVEFAAPPPRALRKALARSNPNFGPYTALEPKDVAISTRILTRPACHAVLTRAFEYAERTGRERVTLADKPSVLRATGGLMVDTALTVAAHFPTIRLEQMDVDKLAMLLVRKPEHYKVIVSSSLFGNIIGDLCLQLAGGLGMAATGSIGERYAIFSPYHGPAPRFTGQYKVSPFGAILSAALLLEWAGCESEAQELRNAVATVISEGEVLPYDLGGTASTIDVAKAVATVWTGGAPFLEDGQEAPAVDFGGFTPPPQNDDSVSSMRFGEAPEESAEEFTLDTFSIDEEPSL